MTNPYDMDSQNDFEVSENGDALNDLLPLGTYQARVKEHSNGKAKSTGNPQIVLKLEVLDGEEEKTRTWRGTWAPKTRARIAEELKQGFSLDDANIRFDMDERRGKVLRHFQLPPGLLEDRYCTIEVHAHEEYQGRVNERIRILPESVD
jgi:hypothetical protein